MSVKIYFGDYDYDTQDNSDEISIPGLRGNCIDCTPDTYVAIDIETTGFAYSDDIIEIAAVKVVNNVIADTFETLIRPDKPIPKIVTDLTCITNDMVENAPSFDEIIDSFVSFIGDNFIMGHNAIFDLDRLNNKLYNSGKHPIQNNYIDTKQLAKERIEALDGGSLINVANHLNVDIEISHRALSDCYTTIKCYNILKDASEISIPQRRIVKSSTARHCLDNFYYNSSIPYNDPAHKVSAKDIVYYAIEEPYYSSSSVFHKILEDHGAENAEAFLYELEDDDYFDNFDDDFEAFTSRLTHLVFNDKRHKTPKLSDNLLNAIQRHNITVISETDMYKFLDIDISDFPKQKKHYLSQKEVEAENTDFDTEHPLYGKTVVITGELRTMTRKNAYLKIKNIGGLCGDSITKKTNYLVTNSTARTGKMKTALKYIDQGVDIKIINEEAFLELLNS